MYSFEEIQDLEENNEISSQEAAFMRGFLKESKNRIREDWFL